MCAIPIWGLTPEKYGLICCTVRSSLAAVFYIVSVAFEIGLPRCSKAFSLCPGLPVDFFGSLGRWFPIR